MAMTLRLSTTQTEALRERALAERTSMQDVAKRALDAYLDPGGRAAPLTAVIEQELARYAGALDRLGQWQG
jgi:hypothetical protein